MFINKPSQLRSQSIGLDNSVATTANSVNLATSCCCYNEPLGLLTVPPPPCIGSIERDY